MKFQILWVGIVGNAYYNRPPSDLKCIKNQKSPSLSGKNKKFEKSCSSSLISFFGQIGTKIIKIFFFYLHSLGS